MSAGILCQARNDK